MLLENDSSAVDFVFLAKDTHPALNINLEKEKCEGSISAAKIIVELAEKVMCTNEILGSFALYLKATGVVFDALKNSSDIIQKH